MRALRRHVASMAAVILAAGASCSSSQTNQPDFQRYLDDASFRRSELLASLVNPANGYSQLRIAHYASGDANDWDLLPEWNPPVERIVATELDSPAGASTTAFSGVPASLELPKAISSLDDPALLALGEAAFSRYPTQLASYVRVGLSSRTAASRYGLWMDAAGGLGGVVRARMADGSVQLGLTCSTCHSKPSGSGAIAAGVPNASLDVGTAMLDAQGAIAGPTSTDPIAAWGPGRLDVTTMAGTEPARIPDLRPTRFLTYLQQDATVRTRDIVSLAIRIETLIITSNDETVRPPRIVVLGLAAYLDSLAGALPSVDAASGASARGAQVFAQQCTSCHAAPGLTGSPVPLGVVGTDETLGLSASRGTGTYRVPSLRGAGTRGPLLHDGTLPSIEAMFDPSRLTPTFTQKLHGTGAVPGHPYGLSLPDSDRSALATYLHAL